MKTRLPVDTLKTSDNGEAISNQIFSINILQAFSPNNIASLPDLFSDTPMSDIQISEDDVYDQFCHLNVNKSPC